MADGAVPITGTLMGYFAVCPREAWLMGHALEPFPDHELLALGRLLQETAYPGERKEVSLPGARLDLLATEGENLVVVEVKRGSGQQKAHRLQLGYYLWRLKEMGVEAVGELRYPEERRREKLFLTEDLEREVLDALKQLERLLQAVSPPPAKRIPACSGCAYYEFCFVGEE